ncbi:MAG TPA: MFS transporter [Acidimicrobiales bacterium]
MSRPLSTTPIVEDSQEALLEGDDYVRGVGSARSAFSHREFRLMWFGSFASNVGTWMQTVVLGAFAYTLTGSSAFVGALAFAQLGPLLLLSIVGGIVADAFDRRRLLILLQVEQLVFSLALAIVVASSDDPSRVLIFACVLAVGIGNALNAPAWGAVLPSLVGPEDLGAAISLNSTMVNGSRVVGPALGGILYPILGAAWIFALNAGTYLAVIVALLVVRFPEVARAEERGLARVAAGFRAVRDNPVVARVLLTLAVFAVLCLPFVSLFPALAETDLGLDADSISYGLLYAAFGLGACLGALSIGTVFAAAPKMRLVRIGLAGFAVATGVFGVLRVPAPAYPVVFVLGFVYFATTTSMLTVLQTLLSDEVRGRVMALWFMAFGGGVSIAGLVFGPLLDATNGTIVLGIGAVVAAVLAWWCDLSTLARESELELV